MVCRVLTIIDNEKKPSQSTFSFKPTASFLQTRPFAPIQTDLDEDATPRPSGYTENFLEKIINQRGTESSDTPVQAKPMNRLKALQAKRMAIQAKLNIGEPNDKYEQEADATASKVVQQINSSTQDQSVQKEEGMKEDDKLQMKPLVQRSENSGDSEASSDVEGAINSARGSGQQLPNRLRRKMENAMGVDFSGVKIHTDGKADVLNRSLKARAFTTGQDIFFKKGEYNPDSVEGQKLIAHESTHTIQQGAVPALQPKLQSNNSSIPSIQLDDDDDSVTTRPRSNAMSLAKPQPTRPRSNAISNPKKQPNESSEPIETSSRIGTSEPEESSSKTTTIGEGTVTTTEISDSVFTGAEASMKTVIEASDDTVRKSFEGLARAGVFGEKAAKRQIETSSGTTATMEGKTSGMMGVETKLSSEVISTMESLTALFEASFKAGFWGGI